MAGTYADQSTLATDNAFIALCRVALLKRALELSAEATARLAANEAARVILNQSNAEIALCNSVLSDAQGYAQRMAWLVAAGNATIGAAAPALPTQNDVQYAVNQTLPTLVR